ncbi:unnamed protein product [Microthlaspi erraticum]|uniref:Uncharacterized protein n=1 Tax=Microthlaspi erraticum TaxID=1685480 RepID=A0A6D2K8G5_9BRAS|nr:unnamed protein product [Microthlaspi erraticum]
MDFIKTSSLRALIELTFQRNWNGLIWMSRKGVTTKRVKTVQTALSRTAPNRAVRLAEERTFHARPNLIRPSEVSAKVQTTADHASRPGKLSPRSATPQPLTPSRARPCREPGNKASRPRNLSRVPRPMAPSEPGNYVPRPAKRRGRPEARFEARFIFSRPGLTLSRL